MSHVLLDKLRCYALQYDIKVGCHGQVNWHHDTRHDGPSVYQMSPALLHEFQCCALQDDIKEGCHRQAYWQHDTRHCILTVVRVSGQLHWQRDGGRAHGPQFPCDCQLPSESLTITFFGVGSGHDERVGDSARWAQSRCIALRYDIKEGCHCHVNWQHDTSQARPSDVQISMCCCTNCDAEHCNMTSRKYVIDR